MADIKTKADVGFRLMRYALAPALLGIGMIAPATAQHGGGGGHASGGGAHSSGFSGGGAHGSFSGSASSFRGNTGRSAIAIRGGSPYAARPGYGAGASRAPGATGYGSRGMYAARPAFYNRGSAGYSLNRGGYGRNGFPGRGLRFGYGYGYPGFYSVNLFYNPFFFDPFFGFGDPFYDDGDAFWDTGSVNGPDASLGYGNGAPYDGAAMPQGVPPAAYGPQPYAGQPSPAYGPETEPGPWALPSGGPQGSAPLRQEALVTIVFKDGRPPEHIRNYALTRSALLVTDAQLREIPLDEIDLATTQRVNHAAGIDFRLPQSY